MTEFKVEQLPAYETMRLLQAIWKTRKNGLDRWASICSSCINLLMQPLRRAHRDTVEEYLDITLKVIRKAILENLEKWDVKP